jgi:hypothetical protein
MANKLDPQLAELQDLARAYWQQKLAQAESRYVGPGKRFKDSTEFRNYIGGVGKGFEEFFGKGIWEDSDEDLKKLAKFGRLAEGKAIGGGGEGGDIRELLDDEEFRKYFRDKQKIGVDPAEAGDPNAGEIESSKRNILKQIQDFANEMNMPIDKLMRVDSFAQALNNQTFSNAMASGMSTGAGAGGLSTLNATDSAQRALLGLYDSRRQAGQNALTNAYGLLNQQGLQLEDIRRYEQGLDLNLQSAAAAAQQHAAAQKAAMFQAVGSMAGGVIGYGIGGAQGASLGSGLGGGLGALGGSYGYKPYQFTYPSSNRGTTTRGISNIKSAGNY